MHLFPPLRKRFLSQLQIGALDPLKSSFWTWLAYPRGATPVSKSKTGFAIGGGEVLDIRVTRRLRRPLCRGIGAGAERDRTIEPRTADSPKWFLMRGFAEESVRAFKGVSGRRPRHDGTRLWLMRGICMLCLFI